MGASDFPVITDETLPSIIEGEIARSIGYMDGSLSASRAQEMNYYYGRPFGNELDGESQVVSTDVADTVEGILPIILNIFTASDDVVRFDPNGPEDEDVAAQQTEVANYVLNRQNNGFLVLYQWFKDALIQKNGIVKYWWDNRTERTKETYQGLTEGEYKMLMDDPANLEVEELEKKVYDDPAAIQAKEIMTAQIKAQAPPEQQAQILAILEARPMPQLYDCTLRVAKDVSQIRIEAIPPEEFGISAQHNCVSIQDTVFCYHRTAKSTSMLREMGVSDEIIEQCSANLEPDTSPESLARDRYTDDTWRNTSDEISRDIWVTECFMRVDFDGDGIAELRHIIMVGRTIWSNEETNHINFAALTPIIMPHRWIGRSVAELIMDIQFNKSVLWRQQMNNLYLTNNPQKAVLSSAGGIVQANLDDLLTSRPGGILREYAPGAIRHIDTPFVAAASFPMLEYMDAVKENRTGVTRYNQGTDADSLNKTARGIQMIQTAGAQRTNLIARIFAETGVKDLMRGIVYMLGKYSDKAMTLKLRNKWVDVDPREWKTQYNMTVNVGLGTGNRDVQLAHLNAVHQQQIELMKTGRGYMVTDENIFNLYKKMSEAMGFKHPELFVSDPEKIPPEAKKPPPDPALVKAQMDAQEGQAKLQNAAQKTQIDAQVAKAIEDIKAQTALQIAVMDNAAKKEIVQMQIASQAQLAVFEKNNEVQSSGAEAQLKQQEAAANIELERAKASEKAKLEREIAEAKMRLASYEAQEKATLARQVATQQAETEHLKATVISDATKGKKSENDSKAQISQLNQQHKEIMQTLAGVIDKKPGKKKINFVKEGDKIVGAEISE